MAEPLHCFIIGLLPIPATYSMDECTCGSKRKTYECLHMEYSEKDAYCTHTPLSSPVIPSPLLIFFPWIHSIPSRLYFTLLFPLSAWIHTVLHHTHTHTEQGTVLIFARGLRLIFLLYYTFQRQVQSLLLRPRRLRVISLQNLWKRHFPGSHRGV